MELLRPFSPAAPRPAAPPSRPRRVARSRPIALLVALVGSVGPMGFLSRTSAAASSVSPPSPPPPTAAAPVSSAVPREYQIKAVFLFNFVQFVDWPASTFPAPEAPLRIGVLGGDPFGPALEEAIQGETVRGHPLVVERSHRAEDLLDCHLVFVGRSEARRLETILALLATRPVLAVSDLEGFARRGGTIGFYSEGKKVRFEINVAAARRADLKISSELLNLGKVVGESVPPTGGS